MITSEYALVDTNVLVYAADKTSPFHQPAKILRDKGEVGKTSLCVCPHIKLHHLVQGCVAAVVKARSLKLLVSQGGNLKGARGDKSIARYSQKFLQRRRNVCNCEGKLDKIV